MILMDKVYIITGGSSGLGKAFAHELIVNFAQVIITGRDKEKLDKVAKELGCHSFHADVTKDEDLDALIAYTLKTFNQLDGIINNAGIGDWAAIDEMDREKMKAVFEINVFGATMMAAKAAKIFKTQQFGDIVNIASTASQKGYKMGSIYAASKFALRALSQCWQAATSRHPWNHR